jgi:hypothetical protein
VSKRKKNIGQTPPSATPPDRTLAKRGGGRHKEAFTLERVAKVVRALEKAAREGKPKIYYLRALMKEMYATSKDPGKTFDKFRRDNRAKIESLLIPYQPLPRNLDKAKYWANERARQPMLDKAAALVQVATAERDAREKELDAAFVALNEAESHLRSVKLAESVVWKATRLKR